MKKAAVKAKETGEAARVVAWSPQQLVDPKACPDYPTGDYTTEEYQTQSKLHAAFLEQKERMLEEVTIARLLARRRLPLTAALAARIEATVAGSLTQVFLGPMAHDDPRVEAWRAELGKQLEVTTLRVYRKEARSGISEDDDGEEDSVLDFAATAARAEDVLACLKLLRDDVAERGGSLPSDARGRF